MSPSAVLAQRRRGACMQVLVLGAALLLAAPARAEEAACDDGSRQVATGLCASARVTFDAFGTVSGGIRSGVAAIGQAAVGMQADLGTLAGLDGWRLDVSAFGIYGRQPTPTLVGSLAPVSNIEALSTVRLFEVALERRLGDWGSIRFGQLAADTEFATTEFGGNLVNGTFGWPVALASTLPSGGPGYPLATPGVRLALGDPEEATGLRVAIFSGDPGGRYGEETDPQRHNRYGTTFSTSGGIFYIGEAVTGAEAPDGGDGPRRWVAKLGGWYHNGGFDSVRFDANHLSLADPASDGVPRRFSSNYGGYAVGEAVLWRGEAGHLGVFVRAFVQPADRNAVSLQIDGGLAWRGPFGRADDTLSLGVSWARIGNASRSYDRDLAASGQAWPVRSGEVAVEVNYDVPVLPDRLSLRPLLQVIFNPGAGTPDERRDPSRSLPDAVLVGMRAVATF